MKLYEYQVKEIFSKYGIGIQEGKFAKTPQEAKQIAANIGGPVVLKSQVLVGGRGKAGGVKIVDDLGQVEKVAETIMKTEIKGNKPIGILVEKKTEIKLELYLGIAFDRKIKKTVIIFSPSGGGGWILRKYRKVVQKKLQKFILMNYWAFSHSTSIDYCLW